MNNCEIRIPYGITYKWLEPLYLKDKSDEFGDHETSAKIMSASYANEHYQHRLSVKDFDHNHWLTKARKVMYDIQKQKYAQNPKYMEVLKATGKSHIILRLRLRLRYNLLKLLSKSKHGCKCLSE